MASLNALTISTEPSILDCPFSPDTDWEGEKEDYLKLMRERFSNVMYGQRMRFYARFYGLSEQKITGRFADEAAHILRNIQADQG